MELAALCCRLCMRYCLFSSTCVETGGDGPHAATRESIPPPAGHHERISRIHGLGMSRTRESMKTKIGQCLARAKEKGEEAQRSLWSQINTRETSNVTHAELSLQREECITCPLPRRLRVETITAW